MTQAWPLTWPEKWARNSTHRGSRFKASLSAAVRNVQDELRLFGKDTGCPIDDVVISSNVTLTEPKPDDPGVACYFKWDGRDCCIAVDIYKTPTDNLQAIAHVVYAERTKMRHGGLNVVRASFRGYAALPPPKNGERIAAPWWQTLGLPKGSTVEQAREAYRKLAKLHHPDSPGGDRQQFDAITEAWRKAQESS